MGTHISFYKFTKYFLKFGKYIARVLLGSSNPADSVTRISDPTIKGGSLKYRQGLPSVHW